ncbi:hypothetical protein E6C27_scaffold160G00260 [Cucumis melo var. makuwa]|uniref:Mucin-19-like n=1 Tax=Cucumis melo var. makuwa TaxID=1194695 RepID=A0A5A7UVR0_CUCMM|nr:hypothetical protein E6C27_scaffold160G00260 [Cucumis melo var. makuwa]
MVRIIDSEETLEFRSVTASVVGTNSPLFGWIRLNVELNKEFSYISGKGFLTTGPRTETGNVDTGYELCRGGTKGLEISWVDCVYAVERCCNLNTTVMSNMDVMHKIDYIWLSIDCGVTISFIYEVEYLTGMVFFEIPRLICVSFGITRLICASFGITRLISVSFGITRLICASFGITRLISVSFGITRLICASFGITRLICASFGITRLICASFGITRLMCKGMARGKKDA